MSILNINGLTHIYDERTLFDEASLSINNGEHAGIVGLNGAGKSTFMNIIAGRVMQDAGEVLWLNNIRWGYLDQHANIDRNQTVMEYLKTAFKYLYEIDEELQALYMAMCDEPDAEKLDAMVIRSGKLQDILDHSNFYDLEASIKKVAGGLGVHNFGYDTLVSTLSGGQRAKLMLAKLLLENLDVMLLDEPTNFLDLEHIEWLKKYLDSYEGTFLLISHDTAFLNSVCKIIISVENRQIKKYSGNYDSFVAQYESNAKQYAETYERQKREIKKMQEYIDRNKARAATAGMANSRKKMLDRIDIMEKPTQIVEAHFDFPNIFVNTKHLLDVENLLIGYDKPLLPEINFTLTSESKLWIRGTNGLGKSTLLKTLMRVIPSLGGSFTFNLNSKVNYIEQDLSFNNKFSNAIAYMQECHPRMGQKEVRNQLAKVGIKSDLTTKALNNLSGGEQVKVKLCALMQRESNLLILDEPTNHLDIYAKESLQDALRQYQGAIILVSHEPLFAESICNEIFDVEEK